MFSRFAKFIFLVYSGFTLTAAGSAARVGNIDVAVILLAAGALALFCFDRECQMQGAQPLTELKRGRTYRVEAMLSDIRNAHDGLIARLVVSWHVDHGHFEYRLVHLMHDLLTKKPEVGSEIRRDKPKYGYMRYIVESPASAFGDMS